MTSSPRMVMTLAPRSTIDPRGRCRGRSTTTAISSGLGFSRSFSALAASSSFSPSSVFNDGKMIESNGRRKTLEPTAQTIVLPPSVQAA